LVIYGILNVIKPVGPTSRDCVNQVNDLLPKIKVAHAGTLDPLASGVLVLLIGPAVRLMDEVHGFEKEYVGRFRLGCSSPSGDIETEQTSVPIPSDLTQSSIAEILDNFVGQIEQKPPAYSAIRIAGKRAHLQARRGIDVEMPIRQITIHSLKLLEYTPPEFVIGVCCSTGTYMRSLGMDIARALGTEAVMTELVRTRVGPFRIEQAMDLGTLTEASIHQDVLPASMAAEQLPMRTTSNPILRRILDGKRLEPSEFLGPDPIDGDRVAILDHKGILRAIVGLREDGLWKCLKGVAHWDVYPDQ
jgi:tRNA pseudouridine55 synthase